MNEFVLTELTSKTYHTRLNDFRELVTNNDHNNNNTKQIHIICYRFHDLQGHLCSRVSVHLMIK